MGICLTSLKKVCRLHGIMRWPHRRLKMIDRVRIPWCRRKNVALDPRLGARSSASLHFSHVESCAENTKPGNQHGRWHPRWGGVAGGACETGPRAELASSQLRSHAPLDEGCVESVVLADSKHYTLKHRTGQRVVLAGLSVVFAGFLSNTHLTQGFVARQKVVTKIIFALLHRPCLARARRQLRQMIRWNSTGIQAGM